MFVSKFDYLRRLKGLRESRDISISTVAAETELAYGTVQRVNKGQIDNVRGSTLGILCRYFAVSSIAELVEYVPDKE